MSKVSGVFAVAIAWGAALLFACQPLLAKLVLPLYGGTPSVWATATFLFQFLLLVGYAVAHVLVRHLRRRQLPVHAVLVVLPLLALPLALPDDAALGPEANPVWWLIRTLLLAVGLPFVVLAMTGPVLQIWYSWTGRPGADDPYVLYAASNVGSLLGLLSYPFLVEWVLPLSDQATLWSLGYLVYAVLTVVCAVLVWRASPAAAIDRVTSPTADAGTTVDNVETVAPNGDVVDGRRRWRWLFWAFLPAGVSLGVTTYLTTDVTPVPLLWVLPLTIYLVTFIVAFGQRRRVPPAWPVLAASGTAVVALVLSVWRLPLPLGVSVVIGMSLVFFTGMAGHSRLAADRPGVEHLTGFYLVVSLGGLLGGLLNGVVAPLAFNGPWEYPLQLALVPLLAIGVPLSRPRPLLLRPRSRLTWVFEVLALVGLAAAAAAVLSSWASVAMLVLLAALAWLVIGLLLAVDSRRFGAGLAALVIGLAVLPPVLDDAVLRERTFFGSYAVLASGDRHTLRHGTTVHGWQEWPEGLPELAATTYYSAGGPLGDVMASVRRPGGRALGFVGLGIGTTLSYAESGDTVDVVEIDPAIVAIASNSDLFTYVTGSAVPPNIVLGDGRLVLENELAAARYDVLVIDAFSSDAVPVHLLTREALELYLDRLTDDGIVALHISNRHLDLGPVIAGIAEELGVVAVDRQDSDPGEGATGSRWVVVARDSATVAPLIDRDWRPLSSDSTVVWTDDYSSLVTVLD